jgi:hypothetical protein
MPKSPIAETAKFVYDDLRDFQALRLLDAEMFAPPVGCLDALSTCFAGRTSERRG